MNAEWESDGEELDDCTDRVSDSTTDADVENPLKRSYLDKLSLFSRSKLYHKLPGSIM